jgi:KipI family sensor histidine kinase inhibitor
VEQAILTLSTRFRDVRDGVLLLEFPEAADDEANRAAIAVARSLAASAPPGFRDAIPAARTVLVLFDPRSLARHRMVEEVSRSASNRDADGQASHRVRIPVAYGGAAALDLSELARSASLTEEDFARRHAAAEYRVAFIGFAPGFAYLQGLPRELHVPRLSSPRPRVAPGAIGIGGSYTGIYPAAMPGGWRLIGQTSIRLFDPEAARPALLFPGDVVEFERVPAEDLAPSPPVARPRTTQGRPAFRVVAPGLFATIQGASRYGLGSSGIPPGGAMDLRSLARANAFLGNEGDAPALEIALAGPELEALAAIDVAIAGADFETELDGRPVPAGVFRISAGSRLRFRTARRGARAYLAVPGGFVETSRPGESSPRIGAGEELAFRSAPSSARRVGDRGGLSPGEIVLRVIPGPQSHHFPPAAMDRFLSIPWRVSSVSDRRGLRLEGEPLPHARAPEIPPEGSVPGSIQVPGGGAPIVLGPDGPVTGGYPKIATIIETDLPLLGQAAPGHVLRFRAATLEQADQARREYD